MNEETERLINAACQVAGVAAVCVFYWYLLPESSRKQARQEAGRFLSQLSEAAARQKRRGVPLPSGLKAIEKVAADAWQRWV